MNELACLVQRTADRLAGRHVGVVVAGLAGDAVEIHGAGRTGPVGGPPGPRTLFEIGSVTKVFTSLALARLVLDGSTGLEEPVAALLPGGAVLPVRDGREITLKDLATHTSGLPRLPRGVLTASLFTSRRSDPYAHCTAEHVLAGLARTKLRSTPGRSFRYSNLGAGLLGLALAGRAGVDYEELVRREVCGPLRLADTVVTPGEEQSDRLARGHSTGARAVPHWNLAGLGGMGALRSTAADLATLVRAQLAAGREPDGPLAPAISLTREVRHRVNPFAWIHLGWLAHRLHTQQGGHLQIWHNGGTGGFRSFVAFDPEKQVGVVVLVNSGRSVDSAGTALLRRLQNEFAASA